MPHAARVIYSITFYPFCICSEKSLQNCPAFFFVITFLFVSVVKPINRMCLKYEKTFFEKQSIELELSVAVIFVEKEDARLLMELRKIWIDRRLILLLIPQTKHTHPPFK